LLFFKQLLPCVTISVTGNFKHSTHIMWQMTLLLRGQYSFTLKYTVLFTLIL